MLLLKVWSTTSRGGAIGYKLGASFIMAMPLFGAEELSLEVLV